MNTEKLYLDRNLQILFGVTLMAVLGVSSITPAFPSIVQELAINPGEIGLLITVFTLPGVILTPVLGVLADRYGRKKVLVPSLLLFGVAGGACALTNTFHSLLALRLLQGIGAASLGSLNVTIIGDLYSGKRRTAAMGYNASVLSMGTASYPAMGGALAMIGWRYPFILPILAIPVGLIVLYGLSNPEVGNDQHIIDYLGSAWQSIKNPHVIGLFIASIVTFIILYGSYLTYFPLLLGDSFGAPPFIIGLIMSSMSLTTAITSSRLGKLSKRYSETTLLKTAFILYAITLILLPFISSLWMFLPPIILFGVAQGINIPSIQTLLAGLAPMEQRAAFMSLNGMVLRMGQTLGPIVMGLVFAVWGTSGAFYTGALLSIGMFLLAAVILR